MQDGERKIPIHWGQKVKGPFWRCPCSCLWFIFRNCLLTEQSDTHKHIDHWHCQVGLWIDMNLINFNVLCHYGYYIFLYFFFSFSSCWQVVKSSRGIDEEGTFNFVEFARTQAWSSGRDKMQWYYIYTKKYMHSMYTVFQLGKNRMVSPFLPCLTHFLPSLVSLLSLIDVCCSMSCSIMNVSWIAVY